MLVPLIGVACGGSSSTGDHGGGANQDGAVDVMPPTDGAATATGDGAPLDGETEAASKPSDGGTDVVHGGLLGDPCVTNAGCADGTCGPDGWCTKSCATNSACGVNGSGNANYCVSNGTGVFGACTPGCATDEDCLNYGSTTSCAPLSASSAVDVCTPQDGGAGDDGGDAGDGGGGLVGDPCESGGDCASGFCLQSWCSAFCTSATDTSCGSSSIGEQNVCLYVTDLQSYACFTGCSTNYDCTQLDGAICQVQGTESVCNTTNGAVGDPCSTDPGSTWTACDGSDGGSTCSNDNWCSQSCTTSASCGKNSTGGANYCIGGGGSPSTCYPGCTQANDCEAYYNSFDAFCLPVGSSATGPSACQASGGLIGDPCDYDGDCIDGTCGDEDSCTQGCTGANDTSCGANSENETSACAYSDDAAGYECMPGCGSDSDCTPYGTSCILISGSNVCAFSQTTQSVNVKIHRRRRK